LGTTNKLQTSWTSQRSIGAAKHQKKHKLDESLTFQTYSNVRIDFTIAFIMTQNAVPI
jgi:hypothetical protein